MRDLENVQNRLGDPRIFLGNKSVPYEEKYGQLQRGYQKTLYDFDQRYTEPVKWENDPCNPALNGGVE